MIDIKELVFPSRLYCACCGNIIDKSRTYGLCDFCLENFRWNLKRLETREGVRYIFCVEYGLLERGLIFRLKYSGDKFIAKTIAQIMNDKLESLKTQGLWDYPPEETLLIPVPLHRKKEEKRGFNQAALIGKHLASMMGVEFLARGLIRTKETEAMRGLNAQERRANIRGTISVNRKWREDIEGKRVILLDDFYTTGSTASACIDALMEGNPREITFLAYARRTPFEAIYGEEELPMEKQSFDDII